MVSPELTEEIKTILQNLQTAGCGISEKPSLRLGMEFWVQNAPRSFAEIEIV